MKIRIIKWHNSDSGEDAVNYWFDKNPNIKVFASNAVGYGFVDHYGKSHQVNYTQIMYEELTSEQAKLTQLNS